MRKAVIAIVSSAALVAAAAVNAATTGGAVGITLSEFKVVPKPLSTTTGKVTFTVRNAGKLTHEFVVLKTNIAPGKLPVKNNRAVETGRVGKIPSVAPKTTKKLTLTLKAGKYVLLCNVPAHYQAKQYVGFTVR